MARKLLTSVVGSYPQPDWLIDRALLTKMMAPRVRVSEVWRVPPERLEQAQDEATLAAIRDQELAGVDIITDGEIRRESYSNKFANALDGVELSRIGEIIGRTGNQIPVPIVSGPIKRREPVEVRDVAVPAGEHGENDQDHAAGPVHDGATSRQRVLPRRREPCARVCRGRQRGGSRAVRGRRRRRAARRAVAAGARRSCAALWRQSDQPRARRRARHHRAASVLRLCGARQGQARERLFVSRRARGLGGESNLDRSRATEARSRRATRVEIEDRARRRARFERSQRRNARTKSRRAFARRSTSCRPSGSS